MRALILATALLTLPLTGFAETREERLAVAEEYIDLALQDMDMAAIMTSMWRPLVQQAEAAGSVVTEDQQARLQTLYMETFEGPMTQLMKDQAGIVADIMTLGEITALRDFYKTPDGRAVMAKLPQLIQAQQPGVMALMQDNLPVLMPKVMAVLNGEEAPPAPTAQP
jgi:hypothetical protein